MNGLNKVALCIIFILIFPTFLFAWEGKVVSVLDGDTLRILKDGVQKTVRLASIDCPENGQPYGQAAKEFTADLADRRTVTVQSAEADETGDIVAFVFVGRTDLNKELLKAGLAWRDKQDADNPELAELEFKARSAKRGLWKEPEPVPPWEWRKGERAPSKKLIFEISGKACTCVQKNR